LTRSGEASHASHFKRSPLTTLSGFGHRLGLFIRKSLHLKQRTILVCVTTCAVSVSGRSRTLSRASSIFSAPSAGATSVGATSVGATSRAGVTTSWHALKVAVCHLTFRASKQRLTTWTCRKKNYFGSIQNPGTHWPSTHRRQALPSVGHPAGTWWRSIHCTSPSIHPATFIGSGTSNGSGLGVFDLGRRFLRFDNSTVCESSRLRL
jgi:hypothetical protein